MSIEFIYPEFEVIRNENRCITCRICQQQCANGVHSYNSETKQMVCDESNCVNCQRCVSFCPTRALKIVKSDCSLRENANWSENMMKEIYKQANSGGVLLSSMGNPNPLPVYWDRILINASQVTNPPIDPLREPMETRIYLGKKPEQVHRMADGSLDCELPPLSVIMRTNHWLSLQKSLGFYIIQEKVVSMKIFIAMEKTPLYR